MPRPRWRGKGRGCGRTLGEVRGEEAAGGEGEAGEMQAWGGFTKSCASHFRISASPTLGKVQE